MFDPPPHEKIKLIKNSKTLSSPAPVPLDPRVGWPWPNNKRLCHSQLGIRGWRQEGLAVSGVKHGHNTAEGGKTHSGGWVLTGKQHRRIDCTFI